MSSLHIENQTGFRDVSHAVTALIDTVTSTLTVKQASELGTRIRKQIEGALTNRAPDSLLEGLVLIAEGKLESQLDETRKSLPSIAAAESPATEMQTTNTDNSVLRGYARIMAAIDLVVSTVRVRIAEPHALDNLLARVNGEVGTEIDGWIKQKNSSLANGLKTMADGQARTTLGHQASLLYEREQQLDTLSFAKQLIGKTLIVQRERGAKGKPGKQLVKPVRAKIVGVRSWENGIGGKYRDTFNAQSGRKYGDWYGHYLILGMVTDTDQSNPKIVTITDVIPEGEATRKPMALGTFLKQRAGWSSNHIEFMDAERPSLESTLAIEDSTAPALSNAEAGDGFTRVTLFGPSH